jgi:drug/metabolite transporter (DMT)-like permease
MKLWGVIAGLSAAAIWGGMYAVSKVVLDVVPAFLLLSIRLLLGAAVLAAVLARTGGPTLKFAQARGIVAIGLLGMGVSVGLQFVGTALSTAANASLVTSASPAFLLLFGALILHERITGLRLAALALASLGVLAVIDPRLARFDPSVFRGNVALLGAAITWGLYSVLVRRVSAVASTTEISLLASLGGLALSLPLAAVEVSSRPTVAITPGLVVGVLYLGIVSTAVAMYLWNRSLALLETGVVSLLFFAQPVVGAGLGAFVLGERLTTSFWLGAALIGAGLILSVVPAKASTGAVATVPAEEG